ncbi:MAG: hypothetical protein QOE24_2134 [Frankiales bacterium]|nr:hypothetical protein [Frankiales bacterium]
MVDQLTNGPPEDQRGWSARLIVALMVLVLVVALVHQLTSGGKSTARPTPSPTLSRTPPTLPPDPLPSATAEVVSPVPGLGDAQVHARLVGVSSMAPAGVGLVLGGAQLTRVGSRASGVGKVPVGPGERVVQIRPIGSSLLVSVLIADLGHGKPFLKIYLQRKGAAPRLLVATDQVFPAFDGRSVFAMRYGSTTEGRISETQLDLTGTVLARHQLPASWSLVEDSPAGILAERLGRDPANGELSTLVLLDRHSFTVRRQLGKVGYFVASAGAKAAWTDSTCDRRCNLVVSDLVKGTRRSVPGEAGFSAGVAAFSPDGRRLAIGYPGRHAQANAEAAAGFVDVVDLATGARHRVAGVATSVKRAADHAWTPYGRWLANVVGMPDQDYRGVGLWPAIGGPVRVLALRVPGADTGALLAL